MPVQPVCETVIYKCEIIAPEERLISIPGELENSGK